MYNKIDYRAIDLWKDLYTLQMVADFFSVSRTGIMKYLRRHGVDTSAGGRVEVTCSYCGVKFKKFRAYARKRRKHYCCDDHYWRSLYNPGYNPNRQGQINARKVVKYVFPLDIDQVVHHDDGDTTNNDYGNLRVFKNHADHMRWHRLGGVESGVNPVWSGK